MAVSGDVIAQDGANAKLHPYLVAIVRWCMSCLWSTATVLLHRLMTTPLQPIAAAKPSKSRPAGKEHLDPEPRVECVVLHHPAVHNLDVIFVHGLYGSLGNTWRQGEWRSKYVKDPEKVHLRLPAGPSNTCDKCTDGTQSNKNMLYEFNDMIKEENGFNDYATIDDDEFTKIDEDFIKNMLPSEQVFITEQFYNNTLINQVEIVDNYEIQAKFVSDLFKNSCDRDCDSVNAKNDDQNRLNDSGDMYNNNENIFAESGNLCDDKENGFNDSGNICYDNENIYNDSGNICHDNNSRNTFYDNKNISENKLNDGNRFPDTENRISDEEYACKCNNSNGDVEMNEIVCKCKINETKECEVGCGCICDECYSYCWPKDWIQVDYPDARVISINYTSDPYLWRPLWVKESKRLRLHERAEQMTQQLLDLEVGQRPVVWVGHSKGGLFIKQIYCEAYEAYLNTTPIEEQSKDKTEEQNMTEYRKDNEINNFNDNLMQNRQIGTEVDNVNGENVNSDEERTNASIRNENKGYDEKEHPTELIVEENAAHPTELMIKENEHPTELMIKENEHTTELMVKENEHATELMVEENEHPTVLMVEENEHPMELMVEENEHPTVLMVEENVSTSARRTEETLSSNEDKYDVRSRAGLWSNSAGFMFYSVPHRGSPLADIKTPLTARSVELIEITKDCSLLLSLQERWTRAAAAAAAPRGPLVRSLVETRRTLMSVLWLRIVSADSADPGIGALCGVSVDHREICKPSSRRCLLYRELAALIRAVHNKCTCE